MGDCWRASGHRILQFMMMKAERSRLHRTLFLKDSKFPSVPPSIGPRTRMVIRKPNPRIPSAKGNGRKAKSDGIELLVKNGSEPVDHWEFLDEIDAPMWVDLSVECKSMYADKDDEWFHTSHLFHQSSSKELKAAFSRIGEICAEMDFGGHEQSSPKLPPSVGRSRGKDYRSREWGKGNRKISLGKKHPVKNLSSKSSRVNSGFTKAVKDQTSHVNVKHRGASKPISVGQSGSSLNSKPPCSQPIPSHGSVAAERGESSLSTVTSEASDQGHQKSSVTSNSSSVVTYEDVKQQNQNSLEMRNSTCTVTSRLTELQPRKCTDINSQVFGRTSDFLSTLRVSVRKSCVTRQALRLVVNSPRQSEGRKSASSSKSSIESSNPHEDRNQSTSQSKGTNPHEDRKAQVPKEKTKLPRMYKACFLQAQHANYCESNKPLGHHRTNTTQQKACVPNRGNGNVPSNEVRKAKESTGTKIKRTMATGKENAPRIVVPKSSSRERAAIVKVQVPKVSKERIPGTSASTTLTGVKARVDNRREVKNPRKMAEQVLDPRATWVREWNRVFLLVCAAGLFVDPLFFYALSISDNCMCLFVDGWFATTATVLRCMTDAMHLCNMWVQFKTDTRRTQVFGGGDDGDVRRQHDNLVTRRAVASRYLKAKKGFLFELFVILPLPQIVLWVTTPALLEKEKTATVMTVFLIVFLFQYLPKIYHSVGHLRRMQNLSGGYIFGTVWWGIALNMIAYFVASHAVGACWYLLGIQKAVKCLKEQCRASKGCSLGLLACEDPIYFGATTVAGDRSARWLWAENHQARTTCLAADNDNYAYGAYEWTVQLVTNENRLEKILLPIFWGLMTLSTFGNLECTTDWLEVVFIIVVLTSGLLLVTMLIGNIKVFLNATTSKKQAMHLKMRNLEWWMRKRRLRPELRQRVRNYERQRWAAMRGVDECQMIRNLPEGLRRDIKYHLCLDLVPLFQHMDSLVLENICDRVKSLIFTKGETITREGDPVKRMLFIVRGHLQSSQHLRDGVKSCCMLGPGNFSGDELLSWCLRRPFVERLPPSSFTLTTLETTEAFGLDAQDVKYVTQHFRYTFVKEKVKRSARYYSPGWRTWAAVAIQLAWRRYKHRLTLCSLPFILPRRPPTRCSSIEEDRLRLYTALLTSAKPNEDEFDF
nr:cyclic nucleotide-gated ion channel 4 [Ipomoea batatas]